MEEVKEIEERKVEKLEMAEERKGSGRGEGSYGRGGCGC